MGEVNFTWTIPEYLDPISIRIFNNPKEMFVAVSTKNCSWQDQPLENK